MYEYMEKLLESSNLHRTHIIMEQSNCKQKSCLIRELQAFRKERVCRSMRLYKSACQ